jgi:hypothetical protein
MTQLHAAVEKGEITPEDAREILEDRSDEDLKEEVLSLLKST